MIASIAPIELLRGFSAVDEGELRETLAGLKVGIDAITREVRDLRVSVHGSTDLNIGGVSARISLLEKRQDELKNKMACLENERNHVRSWLRGAAWVAGAVFVLLGLGGGFSINRILQLLQAIAETQ
jgi:hypothetical protein